MLCTVDIEHILKKNMMQTFSSSIKKCLHYVYFTFTMLQCLIFIIHFFCFFSVLLETSIKYYLYQYQSLFCLNFILTCLTFSVLDHSSQFLCVIKENNLISFFYICISFIDDIIYSHMQVLDCFVKNQLVVYRYLCLPV